MSASSSSDLSRVTTDLFDERKRTSSELSITTQDDSAPEVRSSRWRCCWRRNRASSINFDGFLVEMPSLNPSAEKLKDLSTENESLNRRLVIQITGQTPAWKKEFDSFSQENKIKLLELLNGDLNARINRMKNHEKLPTFPEHFDQMPLSKKVKVLEEGIAHLNQAVKDLLSGTSIHDPETSKLIALLNHTQRMYKHEIKRSKVFVIQVVVLTALCAMVFYLFA